MYSVRLTRRSVLAGAASSLALLSCKDQMTRGSSALAPWQMWGSVQAITVPGSGEVRAGPQLASIQFLRPDTWHFLFFCQLVQITGALPGNAMRVEFSVTCGLGRSTFDLPLFGLFQYTAVQIVTPSRARLVDNVVQPADNLTRVGEVTIDQLVASNINCSCQGFFEGSVPANTSTVTLNVGAFFAPKTHVRAEWFREAFPGGEDGAAP